VETPTWQRGYFSGKY